MSFIPHTSEDIRAMLDAIGVQKVADLFDEIPQNIQAASKLNLATGLNECQVSRLFSEYCDLNVPQMNFIGAGAYQHYTPAVVTDIITRGEFYSAYTPYQAEASQGTLQVIYEYQSMMASLTGLAISNASMYDGASALAESILMAVRANKKAKRKRVLIADHIFPHYIDVVKTITRAQQVELEFIKTDKNMPLTDIAMLQCYEKNCYAAVVVPQLNFYGQITRFDALTNWAHQSGAMVIALVNPMVLALLKAPGSWGKAGADIACGDGQPLGLPLSAGGPYFGFITAQSKLSRQMPGRVVGRTVDSEGNEAFCLTLQAREQHIRRAKATSNICSNQGLLVTAATVYMSLLGAEGLKEVVLRSYHNLAALVQKLAAVDEIKVCFSENFIHETVIELPVPAKEVLMLATEENLQLGYDMAGFDPKQENRLLLCTTEIHNEHDLNRYVEVLKSCLVKLLVGVV